MRNMFLRLIILNVLVTIFIDAINYSDTHDYDAYGIRVISTEHFVALAQNDALQYQVSMAPFGPEYVCNYNYNSSNEFIINLAVGRRQNASQLSFVYLKTKSTDGYHQTLGVFTFSRVNQSSNDTCDPTIKISEGSSDVKVWNREPSEMSTLQVDLDGNYAYGFLSKRIFIYDIKNRSVQDLEWKNLFPSLNIEPHALDIGETSDGFSIAIVAGYYEVDVQKTLSALYLLRLDPPYNMTLMDNYTFSSDNQKYFRSRYTSTYQYNYVMSVSIHDPTQQVLVAIPQLSQTYLFAFNSTALMLINTFNHSARSTAWLDEDGILAGFLLGNTPTLPWAQSRLEIVNLSASDVLYVYPNNQQTIEQWSITPPTFLRLITTYDYQIGILTSDGTVLLVSAADAGYYVTTDDINNSRPSQQMCPDGTYKSTRGLVPCTICPTMTRSSSARGLMNKMNCIACSSDSFCPLASISDLNTSFIQSASQAYAYPTSSASSSFDDILMQNTFTLDNSTRRCLLISPLFWSLIILIVPCIVLIIMGGLSYLPARKKHIRRLQCIFRHTDLIGNGELWFGGLISFSIILLIIYNFWFGSVFANIYPIEAGKIAYFSCDTSLLNAQFTSSLQLLATIKSNEEEPIFDMLDQQEFTMTVNLFQTSFTCDNIATQENVGTYSVTLAHDNCSRQADNATLTVSYRVPYHQIDIQINLTGSHYIGGALICLAGPRLTSNDSTYIVQEMNYCSIFSTFDQTLAETTIIDFSLTKVINRTEVLDYSGLMNYTGIWIPTSTHGALSDRVAYAQRGAFLRYLSTQQTLVVSFTETPFFVMNKQEPVSRYGEILFHNVLFTTTVIGIFALVFLIFKLTLIPVGLWIIKRDISVIPYFVLIKKRLER
ncbi:unnamed protein product [Adineta ricciae]|uniref:Uncharacterized protein n=1 Tax=Adineta ricciae TaxID=249248 RepID=A0A815I7H2_ADIRI|nr:unnamed protein product [Adineta ricciae]